MRNLPSGTVTFLFTDIEGSTALWEHQPEAMRARPRPARRPVRARPSPSTAAYVVKTRRGRRLFAVFASPPTRWPPRWPPSARSTPSPGRRAGRSGCGWRSTPARPRCATATTTARPSTAAPGSGRSATAARSLLSQATAAAGRATACRSASACATSASTACRDLIRPERVFQLVVTRSAGRLPAARARSTRRPHNLPIQPTPLSAASRRWRRVRELLGATTSGS